MNRSETTLFMLTSVDGKISTGDNDSMDVDKDFPKIDGVKKGLQQYYDLEQETDLWSLNSGRVMAKIGINEKTDEPERTPVNFVVVDDGHLTENGVKYLAKKHSKIIIATANENHPALKINLDNLEVIKYENQIDFTYLFAKLKNDFGADKMTIQTGGTLNSVLLREGLIDHLSIVVAPCLIGGKNTSTLIDGESLHSEADLSKIRPLKFVACNQLNDSYINLKYDVMN